MPSPSPSTSHETMATPITDDSPHILLVDDDARIRSLMSRFLMQRGYRVTTCADCAEARARLKALAFDLIVLDVMMPGETGLEFTQWLRQESTVPILLLTARADPNDRVLGLELGADDYLTKPFEPRELSLRIAAILRRAMPRVDEQVVPQAVRFGEFVFYCEKAELYKGEELIRLTDKEREIMSLLTKCPGEPVAREDLSGDATTGNERTIDVQVNRLRRKIEPDPANPRYLQTARGAGYRLVLET